MELTASEAWARILERARQMLPEQTFRTWLEQTEPLALSDDLLAVNAGSDFAAEWIDNRYGKVLAEVAERAIGRPLKIAFRHTPRDGANRPRTTDGSPRPEPPRTAPATAVTVGAPLNERYSFDRFVVGQNNQLSAAACQR
jgi:chromosomal replication initiator protein